jgi:PTH1 family peptidyl-tRNA hydrolase
LRLFVGLGNPGRQYDKTRHNIGFEVIDELSAKWGIPLDQAKHKGVYGIGHVGGEKVILLKPLTYMNLSGESIRAVMEYYDVDTEEIVVMYDDLDMPTGRIRLRQKGSAGGHNGIKSTIGHLGTQEFNRIRVGISRPQNGMAITDWVLGRFTSEEHDMMAEAVVKSAQACEEWMKKPFLEVMNTFNQ